MDTQQKITLIRRGAKEIVGEQELLAKLELDRPLIIKLGVDPTGVDLHLGHAVVFRKLRHFQDLGHNVVLIIGDFTALIGDPSGRDKTRPVLTIEDVEKNAENYLRQVGKILDLKKLKVKYNSNWLSGLSASQIIEMTSQVTVSKIFEHNTFRERFENSGSIRMNELLYPFLQGYDSVALKADVEIGGSDQLYNLTFGRDVQKMYGQEPQVCITMPILTGTDGHQKMSKSLNNYIGIDESPDSMMQKIMRMNDSNIIPWFQLLTDVSQGQIAQWEGQKYSTELVLHLKKLLVLEILQQFHGIQKTQEAIEAYGTENNIPEIKLEFGMYDLTKFIVDRMNVKSRNEVRRLLEQGGISINGIKLTTLPNMYSIQIGDILRVGKQKVIKFV